MVNNRLEHTHFVYYRMLARKHFNHYHNKREGITMLKFFIGLLLGGILGVCMMCVLFVGSEEDRKLGIDNLPGEAKEKEEK